MKAIENSQRNNQIRKEPVELIFQFFIYVSACESPLHFRRRTLKVSIETNTTSAGA